MEQAINIENLRHLKEAFDQADAQGTGQLSIDDFCDKLGPLLGEGVSRAELVQLFMKIDADCGGTVDWNEFTNYFFLDRKVDTQQDKREWRFFPQEFKGKAASSFHRGVVDQVVCPPDQDFYCTCSRDSTLRLWTAKDLTHRRTIDLGEAWVTDCVWLPFHERLAVASSDHAISFYDLQQTHARELSSRVIIGSSGVTPLCLGIHSIPGDEASQRVLFGDSQEAKAKANHNPTCRILLGAVAAVSCKDAVVDYGNVEMNDSDRGLRQVIHCKHKDWVTQVSYLPDVGIVSSSLDSSLRVCDPITNRMTATINLHAQGVSAFVASHTFSLMASGGLERIINLWHPAAPRSLVGALIGHEASITHLAMDDRHSQLISLGADKAVKVWDLRNQKCLQTITPKDWISAEDAHPTCLAYDSERQRLVSSVHKPAVWLHKCVSDHAAVHRAPLVAVLLNSIFQVASGDSSGMVCLWDLQTGQRQGHFTEAHGAARLTAMSFDHNQRRLLTAGSDGRVCMFNLNSGSLLQEYVQGSKRAELCAVMYVHEEVRFEHRVVAAGWDKEVSVWEDKGERNNSDHRFYQGHKEDILSLAHHPPGVIASGDYAGNIMFWSLHGGDRKLLLTHAGAPPDRAAVEAMAFLLLPGAKAPKVLLSCGADGLVRVFSVATPGRLLCTLSGVPTNSRGGFTPLTALHVGLEGPPDVPGGPEKPVIVVVGDAAGNVLVWSVPDGRPLSKLAVTEEEALSCFQQVAWWRAHQQRTSSVQSISGRGLLLVGSQDKGLSLWTLQGGLVGRFGLHTWRLTDDHTWQDPMAATTAWVTADVPVDAAALKDRAQEGLQDKAVLKSGLDPAKHGSKRDLAMLPGGGVKTACIEAVRLAREQDGGDQDDLADRIHSRLQLPVLAPIPKDPGQGFGRKGPKGGKRAAVQIQADTSAQSLAHASSLGAGDR